MCKIFRNTKGLENAKIGAFVIAFPQIILFSLAIQYQLLDTGTLDASKTVWLHMIISQKRMKFLFSQLSFFFPSFSPHSFSVLFF